jgi:hypothetical protein
MKRSILRVGVMAQVILAFLTFVMWSPANAATLLSRRPAFNSRIVRLDHAPASRAAIWIAGRPQPAPVVLDNRANDRETHSHLKGSEAYHELEEHASRRRMAYVPSKLDDINHEGRTIAESLPRLSTKNSSNFSSVFRTSIQNRIFVRIRLWGLLWGPSLGNGAEFLSARGVVSKEASQLVAGVALPPRSIPWIG